MKKMNRLVFIILWVCGTFTSKAQIIHIAQFDSLWHLKLTANGLYTAGNQARSLFTNKANLSKVGNKIGFFSNNAYQYGTITANKLVVYNDIRSENMFLLFPRNRFSPFTRVFIETNKIRKIDFRHEWALGGILKVLQKSNHSFNLIVAGINQNTDYKGNDFNIIDNKGSDKRRVWKYGAGINGYNTIVKNKINAEYRFLAMQNFELSKDYNYFIDITLSLKIFKGLSFNINYLKTFENVELYDVLPYEVQLTYGLSYNF